MGISELIRHLQSIKAEHGDLVVIDAHTHGTPWSGDSRDIYVREGMEPYCVIEFSDIP